MASDPAPTETEGQARKLCIDMCSGLAGLSQAFKDANWDVITLDIDSRFEPTVCRDITQIDWGQFKDQVLKGRSPEVVLASPPCERFSVASHAWPKVGIKKAMEIVGSVYEGIAYLKPRYYLVENPMGRLRWFLGTPTATIRLCDYGSVYRKLTDLWTNVPFPLIENQRQHTHYVEIETVHNVKKPLPRLTNDRARKAQMPYGLSQTILEAVSQP